MNIFVRKAKKTDLQEIATMVRDLMHFKRTALNIDEVVHSIEVYKEEIKRYIGRRKRTVLVAEIKGVVVGFVSGGIEEDEYTDKLVAELIYIYIKKEYRGKGISKLLVQEFENWAKKQNADSLYVEIGANNINSLELHKRMGYIEKFKWVHLTKNLKSNSIAKEPSSL